MKVQATVVLTFQAKSLGQAGAILDDVLAHARERDDVGVSHVEVVSPPGKRAVTRCRRSRRRPGMRRGCRVQAPSATGPRSGQSLAPGTPQLIFRR